MDNKELITLQKLIYDGDMEKSVSITQRALDFGLDVKVILNDGLIKGMDIVGVDFKSGELFLPEVLLAARAMKASMKLIQPLLVISGFESMGKIALGTVAGDIHDIGKNLVGMMLEGAGFEVIDLGTDVSSDGFIDAIEKQNCKIIGISAMLTTTMMMMKETIAKIDEHGLSENVKIMVGGAPVTPEFAKDINGYFSPNASEAVDLTKKLIAL